MAALNIPLIAWCIIVVAITALISVRLFHKDNNQVRPQKNNIKRDKTMNDFLHSQSYHLPKQSPCLPFYLRIFDVAPRMWSHVYSSYNECPSNSHLS